ncbi:hypothetical protein INT47_002882, partial [Mucor saturninus]
TAIRKQIRKLKDQDQFNVEIQFFQGNNPDVADIVGAHILSKYTEITGKMIDINDKAIMINLKDEIEMRIKTRFNSMRREWKNSGNAIPVLTEEKKKEQAKKAEEKKVKQKLYKRKEYKLKGRKFALNLPAVKAKFENNNVTLDQVNRFIVLKYMSEEETDNDSNQLDMFDGNNEKLLYVKKPMYRSNKATNILKVLDKHRRKVNERSRKRHIYYHNLAAPADVDQWMVRPDYDAVNQTTPMTDNGYIPSH